MNDTAEEMYGASLYTPGHRACPGCGASIAVRTILEATGPEVVVVTATGCLETFTSPYPYTPWGVPWLHVLFENAGAVASGVQLALKRRGLGGRTKVVAIGGDGGTFDIGLGSLSGMFERGHDVTYICYDNEAYMNTGVQRSSATPIGASTTTSPPGARTWGEDRPKKDMPAIALAHGIPYVATASVAYPQDLARKVKEALAIEGPKYLEVHCPCPIGWGFDPSQTIALARLAVRAGLVPLFEARPGQPPRARKIGRPCPVTEYLGAQKRFRHLFERADGAEHIAAIQAIADANVARYGL